MEGAPIPNVLPIISPRLVGQAGVDSPTVRSYNLAQNAAFREGDVVGLVTTGTINLPSPQGSMAAVVGPTLGINANLSSAASTVTVGNVAITATSTGAPGFAVSYYVILTYTATTNESLPGQEFIINAAPGVLPIVNVTTTGGNAAATNYGVYVGVYSGGEARQQAALTTTAINTPLTFPNPLTNNIGLNRVATNANAGIIGLAMHDSAALYVGGVGGSFSAGGPANLLGTWGSPPPLMPGDPQQALVGYTGIYGGAPIEICLLQPFYESLVGTAAGITLNAASGYFVADNSQSNKILTITDKVLGSPTDVGATNNGDTFSRVKCVFTAGTL